MFSKEKSDRPTIEQSVQKRTQRAKCNQVSENEFLVGTDKLQIIVWGRWRQDSCFGAFTVA
jgi:hypothetical protein